MPSSSKLQHRYMEAVAHGMKPRDGKGPSKEQAEEFVEADKHSKKWKKTERAAEKSDPSVTERFQHLLKSR